MFSSRLMLVAVFASGCSDYGMTHYTIKYADDTGSAPEEVDAVETPAAPEQAEEEPERESDGSGATVPDDEDCEEEGAQGAPAPHREPPAEDRSGEQRGRDDLCLLDERECGGGDAPQRDEREQVHRQDCVGREAADGGQVMWVND